MSESAEWHPNVHRVVDAAKALGLEIEPRNFGNAKTAVDAANVIGVAVGQIVKSLIFGVDGDLVLAYVSGSNMLDEKKLAAAAGGAKCARVDADAVRNAALVSFIEGRSDVLRLLDAQRVYADVRRTILELRLDAIAAALEARFALGEEMMP